MSMTKRERMYNALAHKPVDKIPKGELSISPAFANKILGGGYSEAFQDFDREKAVRELLNMDFINVGDWPSKRVGTAENGDPIYQSNYGEKYIDNGVSKHMIELPFEDIEDVDSYETPDISNVSGELIKRFAEETDLFVFAQIGGPISMVNELIGMEDYMVFSLTNTEDIHTPRHTKTCRLSYIQTEISIWYWIVLWSWDLTESSHFSRQREWTSKKSRKNTAISFV